MEHLRQTAEAAMGMTKWKRGIQNQSGDSRLWDKPGGGEVDMKR